MLNDQSEAVAGATNITNLQGSFQRPLAAGERKPSGVIALRRELFFVMPKVKRRALTHLEAQS